MLLSLVTDFLGESGLFSSQASGDGCPQAFRGSYPQGVALSRPSWHACWGLRGLPEGRIELVSGRTRCDRPGSRMPRPRRRSAGVAKGRGRGGPQDFLTGPVGSASLSSSTGPATRRPCPRAIPPVAGALSHARARRDGPAGPRTPQRGRGTLGTCLGGGSSSKHARREPPAASRGVRSCPFVAASVRLVAPRALSHSGPVTRMRPLLYALQPRVPHGERVS